LRAGLKLEPLFLAVAALHSGYDRAAIARASIRHS